MLRKYTVEITDTYIIINNESGEELIYWDRAEWIPDEIPSIVNAVKLALTDPDTFDSNFKPSVR